jgi:hypothetical protein
MMPFEGGGAFLPKRTTGGTGVSWKLEPSSFLGFGPSSCCKKEQMESEKEFSETKRKNNELTVIPLPLGFHTQHESAATSAPGLSGRHGSSTSTTSS